jgi:methyl-accepting chemotaxis protein
LIVELPDRAAAMLDGIEKLIARIEDLADRTDQLVNRVDVISAEVAAIVVTADRVADGAAGVLVRADQISGGVNELLTTYQPMAAQAAPLARTVVDGLSQPEVAAAVELVERVPGLLETVATDIMPVLATLDRVGPDMHELLFVVKDLRHAINGIPGVAYLRRRTPRQP